MPAASIDIQVLSDLAFILFILQILDILIQTLRRNSNSYRHRRTCSRLFLAASSWPARLHDDEGQEKNRPSSYEREDGF